MKKFVNFNTLSEWGLLAEINNNVLHQYGLALTRNTETGSSDGCIVSGDYIWEYTDEIIKRNNKKLEEFKIQRTTLLEEYEKDLNVFYKVGLVGFSCEDFDHAEALKYIHDAFDRIGKGLINVMLVSGLTNCGIPKLGYEVAKNALKWSTMGITAKEALQYELFPVDITKIVGDKFGDESEFFINYIDCLIKIGGGEQSKKELQMAKDKGIPVIEYELPLQKYVNIMDFEDSFKQYMHNHRKGVKEASQRLLEAVPVLNDRVFLDAIDYHDASKFSEKEIDGYRWMNIHFNYKIGYPNKAIEKLVDDAWEHHKQNNRHHPEYFEIMYGDLKQMNMCDIAEMVCDWKSMEQVPSSSGIEAWYKKVYNKWNFNEEQRKWIENFIDVVK